MLQPGDSAPDFTLPSVSGDSVRLRDFRGKTVVLYFYPKDSTPGCTKEACSFEENLGKIRAKDAVVLGVSKDSVDSHRRFAAAQGLTFPLLSDTDRKVLDAYGVWKRKSLYGRTFMGIERSTFVIDGEGKIRHIFHNVKVSGHTAEVLAAIESLERGNPS